MNEKSRDRVSLLVMPYKISKMIYEFFIFPGRIQVL